MAKHLVPKPTALKETCDPQKKNNKKTKNKKQKNKKKTQL
jgi:hypothetical protein